jgi:hypothetical protein
MPHPEGEAILDVACLPPLRGEAFSFQEGKFSVYFVNEEGLRSKSLPKLLNFFLLVVLFYKLLI